MSTTAARDARQDTGYYEESAEVASGWVAYAAIILGLAGGWNVFDGILAVSRSHVFTANANYVFSDLRTWGWIILALGIVQLAAAFALLTGNQLARWFGVTAAGVNAIGQLMFLHAYPFWSVAMFTIDMLVIYGLAVHGGRLRKA
jgi:hypothetical protein